MESHKTEKTDNSSKNELTSYFGIVKNIDQRSQILVWGFIRRIKALLSGETNIPTEIISICLLYVSMKVIAHEAVSLKCCIKSKRTYMILLPSSSDWDINLRHVLKEISNNFNFIVSMDWIMQINGKTVDKNNPEQFGRILCRTAPPAFIEIKKCAEPLTKAV
eukprot:347032_1